MGAKPVSHYMRIASKGIGIFVLSLVMGTVYAALVGLISKSLAGPLIAWPVWVIIFWLVFWKFNLLRFTGFIAVLPVSLLLFEAVWFSRRPGLNADHYKSFDRSHYRANLRVTNPAVNETNGRNPSLGVNQISIGADGFRADPETSRGNPDRCRFVLIGDSMIYGSRLPYGQTLGPVLAGMGLRACVFGVTGNSPVDYLSTLRYVADRIEPGAHVAFYIYAYNDFVSLNKYFVRGFLKMSGPFNRLFEWSFYFDHWRRSTWTYSVFHAEAARPPVKLWQYSIGQGEPIRIFFARDPMNYLKPRPLNERQRLALKFFLDGLVDAARGRSWHVHIVIHPDDSEIYANFARRSPEFVDLDPRRPAGLNICQEYFFRCEDMSRYIYERSFAAGKNPYFENDRHFSPFGTRIVAEHFVALTKTSYTGASQSKIDSPDNHRNDFK
ncbi:MAG TPA: hypothetical protein VE616_21720 [Candidatus Udaeobacter sp.]|nr:hypothetical protein [Candidatus Udaeobacter sp.]